jgi:excisionase family DNA binding protein
MVQSVQPFVPIMSQERFSLLVGLSEPTIRGMIEKGHLPTVKIGKRRLIDMVALTQEVATEEDA